MSKTTLYDVRADGKAHIIIAGRFNTAGPVVTNPPGWTWADTGSGVYTVTFTDQYAALISCVASIQADTIAEGNGWTVQTSTYTDGASPTLQFIVHNDSGAATVLASATCFVNFIAVFRNTTVAQ